MIIPKACIAAWNHHHQHTRTFHWTVPNRVLEVLYALHTPLVLQCILLYSCSTTSILYAYSNYLINIVIWGNLRHISRSCSSVARSRVISGERRAHVRTWSMERRARLVISVRWCRGRRARTNRQQVRPRLPPRNRPPQSPGQSRLGGPWCSHRR